MTRRKRPSYQVPLPPPVPPGAVFVRLEGLRTKNPNNGAMGNTKLAAIIKAGKRRKERERARGEVMARWLTGNQVTSEIIGNRLVAMKYGALIPTLDPPWRVTVTRVAPSQGLDPHDGLGAALKGCIDGIADALGLKNDRDPRVTWVLGQRMGGRGEYAVEVVIESLAATAPGVPQERVS